MTASRYLRLMTVFLLSVSFAGIGTGCGVDKSATPDAEMSAALKTRDNAKALQTDGQSRVNDANAVLDGK